MLGTPIEEDWPTLSKLPDYVPVEQFPRAPRDLFTAASECAMNLLSRCLAYEPRRRVSARAALHHPYLPYPTHPSKSPKPASVESQPLEEVDENVDLSVSGPGAKGLPANKLKRKLIPDGRTPAAST